MTKQVFTKAFKLEAVRLLEAGEQPTTAIARERWIKREKLYARIPIQTTIPALPDRDRVVACRAAGREGMVV